MPAPNRVANDVHAVHQRAFDDIERPVRSEPRFFGVVDDELVDTVDQRVLEALVDRQFAPAQILFARLRPTPGL